MGPSAPAAEGGIPGPDGCNPAGCAKEAGFIADIQMRVLYTLNKSVTKELKLMYESAK
jgi:hypothetical protein